ncbi:hypothetical protein LBMAG53_22100 [Planctomycetota bacterium]|nr:hypothetical protein LBMAG53_22100 [Planctomycetota bacterium]
MDRLDDFAARYQDFFRSRTRSVAESALYFLRGLFRAERKNLQQISESIEGAGHQNLQYLLSQAKWDHRAVQRQLTVDADRLLGGHADSLLIIDESACSKKGRHSAGVTRQWNGRLGKVDNSQVGVFAALSQGIGVALIAVRLYLPREWTEAPKRCAKACIPDDERNFRTKSQLALEMIREARSAGARFACVGVDAGYGKEPQFLRELDDAGERFMADVHSSQRMYLEDPKPVVPAPTGRRGRQPKRLVTSITSTKVADWAQAQKPGAWQRLQVRHATLGPIIVEALQHRVWLWDHDEANARQWTVLVVRDPNDHKEIHYALTNSAAETRLLDLVRIERQRFWIEHALGDAKSELGLAHYEVRTWVGWHRHMTLCMMASLFALEERIRQAEAIPLLSTRDVRCILADLIAHPGIDRETIFQIVSDRQRQRWDSTVKRYEKLGFSPHFNVVVKTTM